MTATHEWHPLDRPLRGAWARVERAEKLALRLQAFEDETRDDWEYAARVDVTTDGEGPLPNERWPVSVDFSLRLGDAVHNLRAALDYLAHDLAPTWKRPKFPVSRRASEQIPTELRRWDERLRALQPVPDRPENYWLWQLTELWNYDKHRLLVAGFAQSRDGWVEDGRIDATVTIVISARTKNGEVIVSDEPVLPFLKRLCTNVRAVIASFETDLLDG